MMTLQYDFHFISVSTEIGNCANILLSEWYLVPVSSLFLEIPRVNLIVVPHRSLVGQYSLLRGPAPSIAACASTLVDLNFVSSILSFKDDLILDALVLVGVVVLSDTVSHPVTGKKPMELFWKKDESLTRIMYNCLKSRKRVPYYTEWQFNILGFPGSSVVKNPPINAGEVGSVYDLFFIHRVSSILLVKKYGRSGFGKELKIIRFRTI
ncbi:hypothetical protein MG293_000864 [Ovis ammon polii]|uniref:Uncharacterized protein n=1 Tax=Ovis ammon polii TaxID=230172 RepID=A0AAD4UPB7_OVIAM|nr:hypothetical protein MG293_000864 [Ovis ammon polii]